MPDRAGAEAFILKYIERLTPGSGNTETYKRLFKSMDDAAFDRFMQDIESGKKFLVAIVPNGSKDTVTIENNLAIAEELGHEFFQRIWVQGTDDTPTYLTPNKYLVADEAVRRASQMLIKKRSIPKHNRVIDALTGQPTGESKGGRISYPELQLCAGMGLEASMLELVKYRGGDVKGNAALNGIISKAGRASLSTLKMYSSGVESTATLRTFLTACHLRNNL